MVIKQALATNRATARIACKVLPFVPRNGGPNIDHETVRTLETLLHNARLGRIDGLAWAVSISPEHRVRGRGRVAADTTGAAQRDFGLGLELTNALSPKAVAMALGHPPAIPRATLRVAWPAERHRG